MNYRHSFHAGNAADVFKHALLMLALERLRAKAAPFCVIDTHAGAGMYRLRAPGEFEQGIARLWPQRARFPWLQPYVAAVEAANPDGILRRYPGSPLLIRSALREGDRAVLIEWQGDEHAALAAEIGRAPGITLRRADAWQTLPALVPPAERRGLVLIDPPYERDDELARAADALRRLLARWRGGVYLLWYPIKGATPLPRLRQALGALPAPAWAAELLTLPEDVRQRMNGSGMILVNPPWGLVDTLQGELPRLAAVLAGASGRPQTRLIDLQAPQ